MGKNITITINLPEDYLKGIEILQDAGFYESRSDFIRKALHKFLKKDLRFKTDLDSKLTNLAEFSKNIRRKELRTEGVYI